jgi:hypothetical protein
MVSAKQPHYDYNVTNNYHGINIPIKTPVVVTATTNNPDVHSVVFIWKDASKTEQWRETVTVKSGKAQSIGQPNSTGDWGIQALFVGHDGKTIQKVENVVANKATSVNVIRSVNQVPEFPILGTAGIVGALAIGLVVQAKRKNTKP